MYQQSLSDGEPWEYFDINDMSTAGYAEQRAEAIAKAQRALNGVMRDKMKTSDVDYAQRLIRESSQRELEQKEWMWLSSFAKWYDTYNRKFWEWWENGGRELTASQQDAPRTTSTPTKKTTTVTPPLPSTAGFSVTGGQPATTTFPWKWVLIGTATAGAVALFIRNRKGH